MAASSPAFDANTNDIQAVDALVHTTLASSGFPVRRGVFLTDDTPPPTYIVYGLLHRRDKSHACDMPTTTEYLYRADIFTSGNYTTFIDRIIALLKAAGFYGARLSPEMYERNTGLMHIAIDFYYLEVLRTNN